MSEIKEASVDLGDLDETPIQEIEAEMIIPLDTEILASDEIESEELNLREVASTEFSIEESMYKVQRNDTLMLISWNIYGDVSKWREIESLNPDVVSKGFIKEGDILVFNSPEVELPSVPTGNPYLILNGDTLGKISKNVYDDTKLWKALWYNNRDLIGNPNVIYAGFTIYYEDKENINQREIASKMKMFEN